MQWLVTNWFWILIGIAFIAMHLFGHGGHGGHAGHGRGDRPMRTEDGDPEESSDRSISRDTGGHRH